MILTILPVAIIIFLIVVIAAIIMKGKKFVTIKFTYWLLLIYCGILFISIAAAGFVIGDTHRVKEVVSEHDIKEKSIELDKQLSTGRYAEIHDDYLLKHSSFDYHQESLKLVMNGNSVPRVFIEKKDQDDGMIDAYAYTSGLYISRVDFTEQIIAPKFELLNDQLEINSNAAQKEINLSMMKNEFTITQFTGSSSFFDPIEYNEPIIYLRIPKNLSIEDEKDLYFLQYVNE
ncbi:hypothetical protein R4Z09_14580 [Niallia oryzisoli]|uniref:Uncharacterized protein n=1 Tax=Niallia oryzisoli TaxID=1737571 RepID=A0ABZ2CQW3_9BACI